MSTIIHSQITFKKILGTGGYDKGMSLVQLADTSYIILATTGEFGNSGGEIYLVKTDSMGEFIWSKVIGGPNVDYGEEMIKTLDSGLAIAGYTNSSGNGGYDAYLVKTDIDGNVEWEATYGGSNWDFAHAITQTPDSGFVLVGSSYSYGSGPSTLYMIKTDKLGNAEWERYYSAVGDASGLAVSWLSSNELLIGGYGSNSTDKDGWLMKTDMLGTPKYSRTFGLPGGMDEITDVHEFYDGKYLFVGNTETLISFGGVDQMIYKVDTNLNMIWNNFFGGTMDDYAYAIASHPTNGWTYMTGGIESIGNQDGYQDVYCYELNNAGAWSTGPTLGFLGEDVGYDVVYTLDGSWCLTGYTEQGGFGGADIWLVKYDSLNDTLDANETIYQDVTSTPEPTVDNIGPELYPNPAKNQLFIQGLNSQAVIRLYDLSGKVVMDRTILPGEVIGIGQLSTGLYQAVIYEEHSGHTITRKLIIQD